MRNSTSGIFVSQDRITDGGVRVVFKAYFIILLFLIAVVGNYCCQLNARFRLLRGRRVPLTSTVGWIQGPAFLTTFWFLRSIPGGKLGLLMLLTTILDLVGEFGVAKTVRTVPRLSTKYHPSGMILSSSTTTSSPNINWEAYRWASQAQVNSYRNGHDSGLGESHYGIYKMITNDTHFMAHNADEIGYWSCTRTTNKSITYDLAWKPAGADEIWDNDIWNDLYDKNLLYASGYYNLAQSNVSVTDPDLGYATGPSTHTVILTASNYTIGELFEIKAAIDTNDIDDKGSKQMDTFHCILRAKDAALTVQEIAKVIDIDSTLSDWCQPMVGAMFPGLHEPKSYSLQELEYTLQWYLNSMIMVAGGSESVTTPNQSGYETGNLIFATVIPFWIIAVCILVFLLWSFLVAFVASKWLAIKGLGLIYDKMEAGMNKIGAQEINENTPIGLLDWMTHAAYESRDVDHIPEYKDLKSWILSTTWHGGRRLGIVRTNEHGQVNPFRVPSFPMNPLSTQYQSAASDGYFPPAKLDHVVVETREVS